MKGILICAASLFLLPLFILAKPPHDVVVVLCDDFNPFYTGYAGDPDAETPNLDALAAISANFTNCYATSTVCMPARTSLVTGLYPHNTGCWGNASELFVSPKLTSFFSDLKKAGYRTAMIGKTHWFAGPGFKAQFENLEAYTQAIGIDYFQEVATTFGSRSGKGIYQDYLREIDKFDSQSADLTARLAGNQYVARPSLLQPEETCDWMMTDLATDYLKSTPTTEPVALMIGLSNPHSPFDPSPPYSEQYEASTLTLRENVEPFQKYGHDYDLAAIREARAAYLGKISMIDDLVGRLLSALKERGNLDNTILVFTADHGIAIGEHGALSKGGFWEETARVPFLFRHPELTKEGIRCDALIQLIDLYPTLVELAGGELSSHVLGQSFVPLLEDASAGGRDAVFTEIHHDGVLGYMVRNERYKWFTHRGSESLYDLEEDPYEKTNLIDSAEHAAVVAELKDRLREFLMSAQINLSEGYRPMAERVKAEQSEE